MLNFINNAIGNFDDLRDDLQIVDKEFETIASFLNCKFELTCKVDERPMGGNPIIEVTFKAKTERSLFENKFRKNVLQTSEDFINALKAYLLSVTENLISQSGNNNS